MTWNLKRKWSLILLNWYQLGELKASFIAINDLVHWFQGPVYIKTLTQSVFSKILSAEFKRNRWECLYYPVIFSLINEETTSKYIKFLFHLKECYNEHILKLIVFRDTPN